MNIKKIMLGLLCMTTLTGIISLLCLKGIKVHHRVNGPKNIIIPETENVIEIQRRAGKEPFKFKIKTPERKLILDQQN